MTASHLPTPTLTVSPIDSIDLARSILASLRGDVITPDDASFPAATFGIDPTGRSPEMVVIAADADDVATTIRLALRSGRRVDLQSAGRLSSTSTETSRPIILIVTRLLAQVRIDPASRTARVGVGATWRQVQDAAAPFGLAAVSGRPAGGLSGGRHLTRSAATGFEFSAEHVTRLDVVTAGGGKIQVDQDRDPAAFEEYRRRRGASGLVTAMTITLLPLDQVRADGRWFDADHAADARGRWRELVGAAITPAAATAPPSLEPDRNRILGGLTGTR